MKTELPFRMASLEDLALNGVGFDLQKKAFVFWSEKINNLIYINAEFFSLKDVEDPLFLTHFLKCRLFFPYKNEKGHILYMTEYNDYAQNYPFPWNASLRIVCVSEKVKTCQLIIKDKNINLLNDFYQKGNLLFLEFNAHKEFEHLEKNCLFELHLNDRVYTFTFDELKALFYNECPTSANPKKTWLTLWENAEEIKKEIDNKKDVKKDIGFSLNV